MLRDPPMERTFRFSGVDMSFQGGFKNMFWEGVFTLSIYICRNHTAMLRMDGADNVMTLTTTETTLPPDARQRRNRHSSTSLSRLMWPRKAAMHPKPGNSTNIICTTSTQRVLPSIIISLSS